MLFASQKATSAKFKTEDISKLLDQSELTN